MSEKDHVLNQQYWDEFYTSNHKHTPSQFCVCVLTEIEPDAIVVEFGSGNGRDAHYFASQGHITLAMDLSKEAVKYCKRLAESRKISHSIFTRGDLTDRQAVEQHIRQARNISPGKEITFYSRFVMHTLDDTQEQQFLELLSESMKVGENLYLEFRTKEDESLGKHFGDHYRRFIDATEFGNSLVNKYKFELDYFIVGRGMAKFKEEDPYVSRIIARKC